MARSLPRSSCSGSKAAVGGMGPPAHFLRGHIQYDRRIGYGYLERGAPQDGVRLQPDRPRLPRPRAPGQRSGGAQGAGHHRGRVSTQRLNKDTHTRDPTGALNFPKSKMLLGKEAEVERSKSLY